MSLNAQHFEVRRTYRPPDLPRLWVRPPPGRDHSFAVFFQSTSIPFAGHESPLHTIVKCSGSASFCSFSICKDIAQSRTHFVGCEQIAS